MLTTYCLFTLNKIFSYFKNVILELDMNINKYNLYW